MKETRQSIQEFDADRQCIEDEKKEDQMVSMLIIMIGIIAAIFALAVFWSFIGIAAFFAGGWPFPPLTCVIVTLTTASTIGFGVWFYFKG